MYFNPSRTCQRLAPPVAASPAGEDAHGLPASAVCALRPSWPPRRPGRTPTTSAGAPWPRRAAHGLCPPNQAVDPWATRAFEGPAAPRGVAPRGRRRGHAARQPTSPGRRCQDLARRQRAGGRLARPGRHAVPTAPGSPSPPAAQSTRRRRVASARRLRAAPPPRRGPPGGAGTGGAAGGRSGPRLLTAARARSGACRRPRRGEASAVRPRQGP